MSKEPDQDRFAAMTLEELEQEADRLTCYYAEFAHETIVLRERLQSREGLEHRAYQMSLEARAKFFRKKIEGPGANQSTPKEEHER